MTILKRLQLAHSQKARVVMQLATGSCLMGTIYWVDDDCLLISDAGFDCGEIVVIRYIVCFKEIPQ